MDAIFPKDSMVMLTLTANLGLVLFLFLVGLEVDMRLLMRNWKVALSVGAAGMAIPFGLGAALAYGLYNQFGDDEGVNSNVSFGIFVLFVGVAMAITAFPVLARILTELKLLRTTVGTIVLSAGVGNDVVGWVLLALTVTLVNAGTGLSALYVLLVCIGWVLFLIYAIRPAFLKYLKWSGSLENGPTQSAVGLTLLMVLASAFFTDIIGVHAIFGGFLIGLICPHEGGFAIKLTEKIEDLVSILFLPLYFALSGLRTNIGLLNGGLVWGYVFAVLFVAFFGKLAGGTFAARLNGLVWRESATIGVLMSCKGLVELIVLNIGLTAGIISTRVFTIFVVMALVTTFATTPLTTWLYPPWYQQLCDGVRAGELNWDGTPTRGTDDSSEGGLSEKVSTKLSNVSVMLRLESLPALFAFVTLFNTREKTERKVHKSKLENIAEDSLVVPKERPVKVHGIRVVELSQRTSAVMQVSEVDQFAQSDPILKVFRTFGKLNRLAVSTALTVAPLENFAEAVTEKVSENRSDLLLLPWAESALPAEAEEQQDITALPLVTNAGNAYVKSVLNTASANVAILVDRGLGGGMERPQMSRVQSVSSLRQRMKSDNLVNPVADPSHHIFFPFFGGEDDRVALRLVLQLCRNSTITATLVHVLYEKTTSDEPKAPEAVAIVGRGSSTSLAPSSAQEVSDQAEDTTLFNMLRDSLPTDLTQSVIFETVTASHPLDYVLERAKEELGTTKNNAGDLLVTGRRAGDVVVRRAVRNEFSARGEAGNAAVLGDIAEAVLASGVKASVLVVQARG